MKPSRNLQSESRSKSLHISRLFPNMLTILGLCAGLSSIRVALDEKWELSVIFIVVAAFIDGIDGRLARLLKSTSNFGAELDSLCDFVNFGVAPALVIYLWRTHEIKGLGWGVTLFFAICMVIRLARFNSHLNMANRDQIETKTDKPDRFFMGVPAPAAAGLSLIPMMLTFWTSEHFSASASEISHFLHPLVICAYSIILGFLMVSRIPTFSLKKITIRPRFASFALILASLFFILFFSEPWLMLSLIGLVYLCMIPFSMISHYRLSKAL